MATTDDWQTPDEVIARNVTRLRKRKGWKKKTELARRLGVTKHVIHDYEGGRAGEGRAQRQFQWSELVRLCYVLECTLHELVLPNDPDTRVDTGLGDYLKTEMPLLTSPDGRAGPRSVELGLKLFGVPGDELLEHDALKGYIEKATEMRRAVAQDLHDKWTEYGRQLEETFSKEIFPGDGTKRLHWEDPVTGQTMEATIGLTPPDEPTWSPILPADEQEEE